MNSGTIVVPDRIPHPATQAFRSFIIGATAGLSKETVKEVARYFRRAYRRVHRTPSTFKYPRQVRRRGELKPRKLDFNEVETRTFEKVFTGMSGNQGVQFQRSYMKVGRKRRRTANQVFTASVANMAEAILRWQRVSPQLLGPGDQDISYGVGGAPEDVNKFVLPVHVCSITSNSFFQPNQTFGCNNNAMHRLVYNSANKAFGYQAMTGQNNLGVYTSPEWQHEKGLDLPANSTYDPKGVFHKWTEIRFNLYGSAAYPLTYEILLLTGMPTEMSLFDFAPIQTGAAADFNIFEGTNLNAFLREQTKDYIGNPIVGTNTDRTDYRKKFRILRRKIVKIDPLSYSDAVAANDQPYDASNVRNVNMFIRHDRFRDYDWTNLATDQDVQANLAGQGFDKTDTTRTVNTSTLSDVDRDERVYLMIKCTAPRLLVADDYKINGPVAPTVLLSQSAIPPFIGSYDCVIRNCFRYGYTTS